MWQSLQQLWHEFESQTSLCWKSSWRSLIHMLCENWSPNIPTTSQLRPAFRYEGSLSGFTFYCAGNQDRGAHKQLACLLRSLHFCLCGCVTNLSCFCRQVKAWGLTDSPLLTKYPQSTLTGRDTESCVPAVEAHILRSTHGKLVENEWPLWLCSAFLQTAQSNYLNLTAKLPSRSPLIHYQGRLEIMQSTNLRCCIRLNKSIPPPPHLSLFQ